MEVRSRTGNDLQMDITYHDKNGRVVTERKYDKLIPSFKGRIDTALSPGADWSPWSKLYLQPGEPFASPSPRQYAELEVALVSERPDVGVALDWLEIEFGDPVAQEVVGEIFPVEVQPGERTEFAYYIRPQQVAGRGFDHLEVETSAPIEFVAVLVEGEVVAAVDEPTDRGLAITLAARWIGLRIFDLAGRLVWVREEEGQAGGRAWVWDGRGRWGAQVAPGLYVVELRVEGDGENYSRRRVVAVVY